MSEKRPARSSASRPTSSPSTARSWVAAAQRGAAAPLRRPPRARRRDRRRPAAAATTPTTTWRRRARAPRRRSSSPAGPTSRPSSYDAEPHPTSQAPRRRPRRVGARARPRVAASSTCRCSGICRGMQVMAVAAGGALEQHVPDVVGHDAHCPRPGEYSSHHATPVAGTRLAELLGTEPLDVPTYHHQAVRPETLEDTAYRPSAWHEDGTLEAMEDPSSRLPDRGAVAPRGRRRHAALRRARRRGARAGRGAAATGAVRGLGLATPPPGPGDNRPMTKLNRLAIAAGAASALGALAAAGKGVNDALGRATVGCAARPGPAVAGLPRGGLPQHPPRDLVDADEPARRAAPLPRERRHAAARHADPGRQRRPRARAPRACTSPGSGTRRASSSSTACACSCDPVWSERCSPSRHVGPAAAARGAGAARRPRPHRRRRHLPRPLRPPRHGHHPPSSSTSRMPCSSCRSASGRTSTRGACPASRVVECDWEEGYDVARGALTAVEAQHFSGRGLRRDGTLWASWVLAGTRRAGCSSAATPATSTATPGSAPSTARSTSR